MIPQLVGDFEMHIARRDDVVNADENQWTN